MRLFVAVFPPQKVSEEALEIVQLLPSKDRICWSKPENLHLTLKFLRDVEDEKLDELCTVLENL
ncbi:MAG TPA: 2'-5' RNA ligase family protein, partial [Rubrobacteraceae bacterium]|nr:2'-5' RNA ligase family protein [Rubrobacteraceae bacterium]